MNDEDEQLVTRMIRRETDALAAVIDKYGPAVTTLTRRILQAGYSEGDIEECVSDAFVRAWQTAADYRPDKSSVRTWLLMTAKYTALDFRRKHRSQGIQVAIPPDDISQTGGDNPVEQAVLSREEWAEFCAAVSELNEIDKRIFYQRYVLYESIEQIANGLSTTRQAIDNRLWRIRRALKQRLHHLDCGGGI
ncbi:sigma-70 family RNA polymerase sigma factor [Alicyclobacillus fastidiosus]|uniref:Sigma-70 family RNA polymerase sigma factor n=1 Tax=Alicyclobacillus fastidiosus TaxID=392011 RepID=A0ABV5AEI4_9BACL|nr:sigma-70 family RNA polymerase sigma factor [Alicyclobacillus fastidiosus]WEH09781.1 sigma-70 family RNA polymerase sigma factor [Alicyclobacillus fastidiosus]